MAGMGMMAARKKPQALVIEVRVMFGPTCRMLAMIRCFSEEPFIASSITKKASPMTNMSSTPNPSTRKGSTCRGRGKMRDIKASDVDNVPHPNHEGGGAVG